MIGQQVPCEQTTLKVRPALWSLTSGSEAAEWPGSRAEAAAGNPQAGLSRGHPGSFPLQLCLLSVSFSSGQFWAMSLLPSNNSPFLLRLAREGLH